MKTTTTKLYKNDDIEVTSEEGEYTIVVKEEGGYRNIITFQGLDVLMSLCDTIFEVIADERKK